MHKLWREGEGEGTPCSSQKEYMVAEQYVYSSCCPMYGFCMCIVSWN